MVKNPPANSEMWAQYLGQEVPWRRNWQPTSILAWRIPRTEEPSRLQSMGSHSQTGLSDQALIHNRKILENDSRGVTGKNSKG